ncbi:MAG TPA: hypothetical protein VKC15_00080 [Gemmatimonadales bacterium]|nr:hypothetical protein [Gemmatimonadales bacterium]
MLISGGTHILLDPGTRTGTFKTVEIVTFGGGELAIDHTSGNAAVVPCPYADSRRGSHSPRGAECSWT